MLADAVGVPSFQVYVARALPPWKRRGAEPSAAKELICGVTPDLRLTDDAELRPQCTQSALPSAVRLTFDAVALTAADSTPLSPTTVNVTSIVSCT